MPPDKYTRTRSAEVASDHMGGLRLPLSSSIDTRPWKLRRRDLFQKRLPSRCP